MIVPAVVDLTRGELLNTPAITRFGTLACDPASLSRGGLFFAFDPATIPEAVAKGAYGIVTDTPCPVTDPEIAWILVADLTKALAAVVKFRAASLSRRIIALSPTELALLASFDIRDTVYHLSSLERFARDLDRGIRQTVVACCDTTLLDRLGLSYETLDAPVGAPFPFPIVRQTLSDTVFDTPDGRIGVAVYPAYAGTLARIRDFFLTLRPDAAWPAAAPVPHLQLAFVTAALIRAEPGRTDRIIVASTAATDDAAVEIATLSHIAPWSKLAVFAPHGQLLGNIPYNKTVFYRDPSELPALLASTAWQTAYIYGTALETVISQPTQPPTLFDFGT